MASWCSARMQGNVTDGDITELIGSTAEAASAYIRGDIRRYLALIKHGDDYTLMPPYGGETARGFDAEAALESTPKMFRSGEADLELVETYASGDLAVLVAIERQHGEVAGMPDQDWSLPVVAIIVVRLLVGGRGRRRGAPGDAGGPFSRGR